MFLFCGLLSHFLYPISLQPPFLYDFLKKYALFLRLIRSDTVYFYIFYICFLIFMTNITKYVFSYNICHKFYTVSLTKFIKFHKISGLFLLFFMPLYTLNMFLLRRFFLTAIISILYNLSVLALIFFYASLLKFYR